jgi:hypothetical protein
MAELRWTPSNQEMVGILKDQIPGLRTGRLKMPWAEVDDLVPGFVPDGYVVEDRRLDLFEVEVTHHIPRSTMVSICYLWMACDACDIEVNLYVVNRYGHINILPLAPIYYRLLQEDVDADRLDRGDGVREAELPEGMA